MRSANSNECISIILKLVGEVCNLDCVYCYEKRKPYAGQRVMPPQVVQRVLEGFGRRPLRIEMHGGEPLLYPKSMMRRIVRYLEAYPGSISVSIQTNGTQFDEEWLDVLEPIIARTEIGVSLDGPQAINLLRTDHNGDPSVHNVLWGLDFLEARSLRFGVISVVTQNSIGHAPTILDFFSKYSGLSTLKFVPCFDVGVSQGVGPVRSARTKALTADTPQFQAWAMTPAAYGAFLNEAFDHWTSEYLGKFVLEPHLAIIQAIIGGETASCTFSDIKCNHVLTLYPDGSLGSCDEFNRQDVVYGDARQIRSDSTLNIGSTTVSEPAALLESQCMQCDIRETCRGGCIATRIRFAKVNRENEYCDYRRMTIDHVRSKFPNNGFAAKVAQ